MKRVLALVCAAALLLSLAACAGSQEEEAKEVLDLRTFSVDEIIEGAKKEGVVESVGMPDDWTHWDWSFASIKEKYGVDHNDVDMSSGEEIALFAAEKDDPTKDIGDIGYGFTNAAKAEDVLQPFTLSCWDSIPDWAKDPEGYWAVSYTGTTCFVYNDIAMKDYMAEGQELPTTWKGLLEDTSVIVCPGMVATGAAGQVNVLSCNFAMGGDWDNVQPGIDYFKELARQGRLSPLDVESPHFVSGECICSVSRFDFNGVVWEKELNEKNLDKIHITCLIPQDGAVSTGYAQIINKYAPHPFAAALTMEYIFSEQGQIERAYGGARPIRSDITLPDDVPVLSSDWYTNTVSPESVEQLENACNQIAELWVDEVLPLIN